MQYQVQEMLRVERIFEPEGIQEELDAYNPLIPDGSNWKATFMIEYPDADERKRGARPADGRRAALLVQVADFDRVYAIADEDLERENAEKTSSVHFLRFELTPAMCSAVKSGTQVDGRHRPSCLHAFDEPPAGVDPGPGPRTRLTVPGTHSAVGAWHPQCRRCLAPAGCLAPETATGNCHHLTAGS